jgi:hypothetical protein
VAIEFEKNRLRQKEIEVRALVALLDHSSGQGKKDVVTKLVEIAFPEKLVEQIEEEEQTKLEVAL